MFRFGMVSLVEVCLPFCLVYRERVLVDLESVFELATGLMCPCRLVLIAIVGFFALRLSIGREGWRDVLQGC